MKKYSISLFLFFLIFFSFVGAGFSANLEVFTRYDTDIKIYKNNTFEISKKILLRNIHDVGIVPGEIQFKIYKPAEHKGVNIVSVNVTNRYGHPIKNQLLETDEGYVVMLDIFTPVLPGFEYMINLDVVAEYEPTGFFFRNLEIPLKEDSQIPIKDGIINVEVPQEYTLTYVSFSDNDTVVSKKSASWKINSDTPSSVNIEYSSIPIRIGGLKGSLVFWLVINFILISLLIIHVRKAILRNNNNGGGKKKKK